MLTVHVSLQGMSSEIIGTTLPNMNTEIGLTFEEMGKALCCKSLGKYILYGHSLSCVSKFSPVRCTKLNFVRSLGIVCRFSHLCLPCAPITYWWPTSMHCEVQVTILTTRTGTCLFKRKRSLTERHFTTHEGNSKIIYHNGVTLYFIIACANSD